MPWTAAAIAGGAVLGAVASNQASKAQSKSASDANDVQLQMYNQTREDNAPTRALGNSALSLLSYGIGAPQSTSSLQTQDNFDAAAYLRANPDVANAKTPFHGVDYRSNPYQHYLDWGKNEGRAFTYTPQAQQFLNSTDGTNNGIGAGEFNKKFSLADYQADPGYQFRLDQGKQALERSAAARGGLLSGGTLKDLTDYSQGMASQEYGNAYNRFNNDQSTRFQRLATLAGFGTSANNTNASVGSTTAGNIGNNLTGAGNATASGYVGGANAVSNSIGQGLSSYSNNKLLDRFAPAANDYSSVDNFKYFGTGS